MILKPQDLMLVLKLISIHGRNWTQVTLASELGFSQGEVSSGLKRALAARLLINGEDRIAPARKPVLEFLLFGVSHVFIPDRGPLTRGMPTGEAAPVFANVLAPSDQPPPVWPDPDGAARGETFSPLYRSAPFASSKDSGLYDLLALVDGLRGGRARVRKFASDELKKRLGKI